MDTLGMLGSIMGAAGMDNIIPAEGVKEIKEGEEETVKSNLVEIKTATPYNMTLINHNPDKGQYGRAMITFICRDNEDKLTTISTVYNITKDNEDFIYDLGFIEDDELDFIGRRILNKSLTTYLPSYVITKVEFSTEDGFDKDENPHFTVEASQLPDKNTVTLRMSTDIASCIMFIDSYIKEMIENEHDLMLATTAGSKVSVFPAKIFVVDNVEAIVEMAGAEIEDVYEGKNPFKKISNKIKKPKRVYSTTVGLVLKVSRFVEGNKETDYILTPFDVGQEFDKSKFRGKTITDIQNMYFGDADQFVSTLMISDTHLGGVDKSYMIIRGKNKFSNLKLYLFDHSAQEVLKHLIETY